MATPLSEFLKNKGINVPNVKTVEPVKVNVVNNLLKTPTDEEKQNTLRWIGKQLMKPVGVVSTIAEQTGKTLAEAQSRKEWLFPSKESWKPITEIPKKSLDIITGKTERSFTDIWKENLPEHPIASTIIGLVTDIVADPLNYIGGITKAGLSLAKKGVGKISLFQGLKTAFSTKTGIKEFDMLLDQYKSLGEYKKVKVMESAKNIQKEVSTLPKEDIIKVSNYIEKGTKSTPQVNALGEKLKNTYQEWKSLEKELGVKGGEIAQYTPHIKAKVPLVESIKKFISPSKQWSTKLAGAEKGRTILKFVSEEGEEIIGKVDNLGLKKIDTIKGLSHEITFGEFKSLSSIKDVLNKYGYGLRFKPQQLLRGSYGGYFDPIKKEIVIASKQPTLENVVSILKHEITHNAHFQLGGNIETLETFTGKGKASKLSTILNVAKNSAKNEWEKILESRGVFYNILSPADKVYYRKPTELLSYAMQTYLENPDKARLLFPKTVNSIIELQKDNKLFNILDTSIRPEGLKIAGDLFKDKSGNLFQSTQASIEEISQTFGKKFFEENPAIQMAYRGLASAKATTSKEFFDVARNFAVKSGVEVTAPELKGLRFDSSIAKAIDNYYKGIQPEELKVITRTFDAFQNWWKGQVLIAPSYHIRNSVGNIWNNFLAGVKNPLSYIQAGMLQSGKAGDLEIAGMKANDLIELMKKRGVINEGWYAADIPSTIEGGIQSTFKQGINPLSQQNYLFKLNKGLGSIVENNARIAHFIDKLKSGSTIDDAVMSVKKYLFNYQDLTEFEKTVMKRVMPFYTWTRKNVPLQLEHLITQPGKYAGLEKAVRAIEKIGMGDSRPVNEKYLSDYIKNNTAMRVKYNEDDKTYYYFLLGNWLPSYQAIDFLSQPLKNIIDMVTPLLKTPIELLSNKSFFKNTLGESEMIENYPGQTTNFLGFNVPVKTATVLRNIRFLNELDKLNPGKIFGGKIGEPSIFKGLPSTSVFGLGTISPATYKYGKTAPTPTTVERTAGLFLGKLQSYKERQSREYYQMDTDKRILELKQAITSAIKKGDKERVKVLIQQLKDFKKQRGQ